MNESRARARRLRLAVLKMVNRANASHVGSCFSMADILAVLYSGILRVDPAKPDRADRDRFVMSKGHGAAALYAVLADVGFFPAEWLQNYCEDDSPLAGHVSHHGVPGVEVSTGSLGHGLSIACGMAIWGRAADGPFRVFALLSDGELDEGSVWEAALLAGHHGLENLVAIVDYNRIQSFGRVDEVIGLEPLADKWRAFGWGVASVDGHDHDALDRTLRQLPISRGRPNVLLANTVKGKGVSFMEDQLLWHYRAPDDEQLRAAIAEVEAAS